MKIHRVKIDNFRNFKTVDVYLDNSVVIVGENKAGKTNFLHALRLVLDPSLPDSARQLHEGDFWSGLANPIYNRCEIKVVVELANFEDNEALLADMSDYLVSVEPMIARFTYLFRPASTISGVPKTEADYEFLLYGGDREETRIGYDTRRRIPMSVLHALRDVESDLSTWRKSPLRPMLDRAALTIEKSALADIATQVLDVTSAITKITEIADLEREINERVLDMVGSPQSLEVALGFSPTNPDHLLRAMRLLIDSGLREVSEASLGSMNVLYLALKSLELRYSVLENSREHSFWAIEEPEAHLHPHLQRQVYRDFLKTRHHMTDSRHDKSETETILLTTHSPHIVSVSPLRSIVLLRRSGNQSVAVSTATLDMDQRDIEDIERYLDVTRGEMLFAKGVILVEGDAEQYLVPRLAAMQGVNLDAIGITVCSVSSTNFLPYVRLLNRLGIPYSVLTDYDPRDDGRSPLSLNRVMQILEFVMDPEEYTKVDSRYFVNIAQQFGIFVNNYTLEIDMFKNGLHSEMCTTIIELSDIGAAKTRAAALEVHPETLDAIRFLKDIEEIGKGRFAQRLASHIQSVQCPAYVKGAIDFVSSKCSLS